jgi:hypothetical protein
MLYFQCTRCAVRYSVIISWRIFKHCYCKNGRKHKTVYRGVVYIGLIHPFMQAAWSQRNRKGTPWTPLLRGGHTVETGPVE